MAQSGQAIDILNTADAKKLLKDDFIINKKKHDGPHHCKDVANPSKQETSLLTPPFHRSKKQAHTKSGTWYRAVRSFVWHDQLGASFTVHPGELVDILNRYDAKLLLTSGLVCVKEHTAQTNQNVGPAAPQFSKTKRVGIWLLHTPHYSGGRVHVYQYANCLAQAGAEIFYITNGVARPLWEEDYPICDNIHFLNEKNDPIPNDLDIVMTDSKGNIGLRASAWTLEHPHVRFVCLNFETANWVKEFVPEIAANMNVTHLRQGYAHAHILLGNSTMSTKYLKEWMGPGKQRYDTLCPAINTHA